MAVSIAQLEALTAVSLVVPAGIAVAYRPLPFASVDPDARLRPG